MVLGVVLLWRHVLLIAFWAVASVSVAVPEGRQCLSDQSVGGRAVPSGHVEQPLSATIRVVADAGNEAGSSVELALRLSAGAAGLPDGWRLCFTWVKAVVLRPPRGARTAGSFVELGPERPLPAGGTRVLRLSLGPPAMRHASDLPQGLHVVLPASAGEAGAGGEAERVLPVALAAPSEGHARFDPDAPPPSGIVPLPLEVLQAGGAGGAAAAAGFGLSAGGDGGGGLSLRAPWPAPAGRAAELLGAWLAEWPPGAPLAGGGGGRQLVLVEGRSEALAGGGEGYELVVESAGIRIEASSGEGFLRGAASLMQVLGVAEVEGRSMVPAMTIRDRPRFRYRGLMLDVARHFFPVEFIKRLLDWMFLYKLNAFHWHLTDDEGWRLEIESLPNLTDFGAWRGRGEVIEPQYFGGPERYGGFYSHADVREIVRYASARGIAIVPEIDVPGHSYAAVRALPGLLGGAVRPGGPTSVQGFQGNVLDPAHEGTYVFLEKVFSEVADLFPAPLGIHIGMDEVAAGSWSKDWREERRLKAALVGWLQRFLAARGRRLLGWEEAFEAFPDGQTQAQLGLGPGLGPPGAFAWKPDERFAVQAARRGLDVVLSPAHFLYLDIVEGPEFEARGLYWAAPALPLERVYAYEPLERLAALGLDEEAFEARILGVQAALWSETVFSQARAEEALFPRLLAAAELAWSQAERRSWQGFQWRLAPQLQLLARAWGAQGSSKACGVLAAGQFLRVPGAVEAL